VYEVAELAAVFSRQEIRGESNIHELGAVTK
jgi:hypothetical protein